MSDGNLNSTSNYLHENTRLLHMENYHFTADLLFDQFAFSSFVTLELSTDLLVWLYPNL